MITKPTLTAAVFLAALTLGIPNGTAAPTTGSEIVLTQEGNRLLVKYTGLLTALQTEIGKALPKVGEESKTACQQARETVKAADAAANAARQSLDKIQQAKGLVDHAKGKWIGGADKGIAQAQSALTKASTDAEREAAKKDLAKWQADKAAGLQALQERQAALDQAKREEPELTRANEEAQAALARARAAELAAGKVVLAATESFLTGDALDTTLVKCAVLTEATPRGLADFAGQGAEQKALVEKLLADGPLMKQMLVAGGAKSGRYGRAMDIYTEIQTASSKAREGMFQRLALATALEHAVPVEQSNAKDLPQAPATVDPVKRYLHYEKAYLAGELDPAFANFTVWEYRMVVACDAPDEILSWGREMLRNYRPDHISTPDYGWRYVSAVRTDVAYGSQNVEKDLASLQNYQNIIMNGGVCGRRAFFGRFILRAFGIPVWGVTQHKHAALSHWTPKGWVVNLGAGFPHSWWDKDEAPRSGSDFLLETQARAHGADYLKVLRAQWVSRVLGEPAYNDRKKIAGGFWSALAHDQAVALAASAVGLGPLGRELAEANEAKEKLIPAQASVPVADQNIAAGADGVVTVPATAHVKTSGRSAILKSFAGVPQVHASGGFKAEYEVTVPQAGRYVFAANVVTVQGGHQLLVSANDAKAPVAIHVPCTLGEWRTTRPVELPLAAGRNVLHVAIQDGSRGISIQAYTLSPVN